MTNSNKLHTIHTSRTIMFAEVAKVMDYSIENNNFLESLGLNVTGKKSSSGVEKTANYLRLLYGFDLNNKYFTAFKYFWSIVESADKPSLAFIYAINHDDLLAESMYVMLETKPGSKATIELFEQNIETYHPNKYSDNTRRSMAQNIASSWKQAGFLVGKVKNIRTQPAITYNVACFAFFMAYLKGDRGEFIWKSIGVKSLFLGETRLRELAVECAKRDLMQYQYAGSVTAISFSNLLNKLNIDAI
jgi:hypothetical protein